MRFILLGDWPCSGGAMTVPAGTVIEWDPDPEAARVAGIGSYPQYLGVRLPEPMPPNAKALDQSAYDYLVAAYEPISDQLIRTIHYANGVQPKKGN